MLQKKLKAFTLVECLISIAVLGVASLTMAQVFSAIGKMNMENHTVNESLSMQMSYVEQKASNGTSLTVREEIYAKQDASGTSIDVSDTETKPPHLDTVNNYNNITITKKNPDGTIDTNSPSYSFPVDMFVLVSRNSDDTAYTEAQEDQFNLRYKYILGHTN